MQSPTDQPAQNDPNRRLLYGLLILITAGMGLGRILSTVRVWEPNIKTIGWKEKRPEPMPTFSSNDRSRLATVRALVEQGTYKIGQRDPTKPSTKKGRSYPYTDSGITFEPEWGSVDRALDPRGVETDPRKIRDFYSTKPPLYPTIIAGEYWVLHKVLKLSMDQDRWIVVRVIVITFNLLPFLLYLYLLSLLVDRLGVSDWGRLFVFGAGCFATMITPFLISINNHIIASCSVMIVLYSAARIYLDPKPSPKWFLLAGFFAGFAACNELPSTAVLAGLFFVLAWSWPKRAFLMFLPMALIPIGAFFLTNYLAIKDWVPIQAKFGSKWYVYQGSHWNEAEKEELKGIDRARHFESRATYAFHLLVGHHGLFSLMPIFILSVIAMIWGTLQLLAGTHRKPPDVEPEPSPTENKETPGDPLTLWRWHCLFSLILSGVVIAFYLIKTNNYGGWSNGPRWLMWLTPFLLIVMLPLVDRMAKSRTTRYVACTLLLISVLSMSYRPWNPWRHPWIYNWMEAKDLIPYDR